MKLCLLCSGKYEDGAETCTRDGSRLVPAGNDSLVGKVIFDRYLLEELIAKGSVGRVYKAKRLEDNKPVAIKVLRENLNNDAEALARFRREAQMLSILEHPNILSLLDFGQTPLGEPYFAAEFLPGKTLAQLIAERRSLAVSEAEPIFRQVCLGLAEAHSHGFIHRDIKPSNIIINEEPFIVKLLDFSLAKLPPLALDSDRVTTEGMLRGTPAYMSPEQCQSMEVDERGDIYSLAVVIFETLTGTRPFASKNSVITMHQQINDVPPRMMSLRPDLHFCEALEVLVQSCLAKNVKARPPTVQQFLQEFEAACAAQSEAMSLQGNSGAANNSLDNAELSNKVSPLAAFQEAERNRLHAEATLASPSVEAQPPESETKEKAQEAPRMRGSIPIAQKEEQTFMQSVFASELGRKLVIGIVLVVVCVMLLLGFLFIQIPG